MDDHKITLGVEVPDCIDKALSNLTDPVTKGTGSLIDDIGYILTGGISEKAEKLRIQRAFSVAQFKKKLEDSINDIPEDARQQPKTQVVGLALDRAQYCIDEIELRDMFVKLISRAADSRYNSKVHPSFSEIISQMSPLDAENLALFQEKRQYPIAEYQFKAENGGHISHLINAFLGNPDMTTNLALQASSLTSLSRLGLVSITYETRLEQDDLYEPFQSHPVYAACKDALKTLNAQREKLGLAQLKEAYIQKGVVKLTPFGRDFVSVCLAPNPS